VIYSFEKRRYTENKKGEEGTFSLWEKGGRGGEEAKACMGQYLRRGSDSAEPGGGERKGYACDLFFETYRYMVRKSTSEDYSFERKKGKKGGGNQSKWEKNERKFQIRS